LLPEDKLKAIEAKMALGGKVGMVGDGINDAPALARSDIGFAMGAAGTGTAIETADVALMDDDLRKLPRFVRLSRHTHAVLVQNIVLALGIKAVFLVLTLMGTGHHVDGGVCRHGGQPAGGGQWAAAVARKDIGVSHGHLQARNMVAGQWIRLEGFILDRRYLQALQSRFAGHQEPFCGYGAATPNLQCPPVDWVGKTPSSRRMASTTTSGCLILRTTFMRSTALT
jgi:hypothetical protein